MSQQKVKVRWSTEDYLETESGRALYIFELHRTCALVPFFDAENPNWGDAANDWISQWKPCLDELYAEDELDKDLMMPIGPRPNGQIQATFCNYQLYFFEEDENEHGGEVKGFWKLATEDLRDALEERASCGGGETEPPSARGP